MNLKSQVGMASGCVFIRTIVLSIINMIELLSEIDLLH